MKDVDGIKNPFVQKIVKGFAIGAIIAFVIFIVIVIVALFNQ